MSQEEWLTVDEAAKFLGVARRTLHQYVKQGRIPSYRAPVGRRTLFRKADLEAFLQPRPVKREEESARAA